MTDFTLSDGANSLTLKPGESSTVTVESITPSLTTNQDINATSLNSDVIVTKKDSKTFVISANSTVSQPVTATISWSSADGDVTKETSVIIQPQTAQQN